MRHRWAGAAALLACVGLAGCGFGVLDSLFGPEGTDACASDDDCEVGERCEEGVCVDQPAVRAPRCGESNECPFDILFVIDNSGSMMEEQELLAQAIPPLIRELEARQNHFHIGVITTDMNDCDAPYGSATRGSVPQRGCLQTSQTDPSHAVVTWETPDAASKLADIIRNVGIFGSAYEKGLEAAQHFLTAGHSVPAPSACDLPVDCTQDLSAFLRPSATNAAGEEVEVVLLVIFVTDEDDCSHGGRIDETVSGNTDLCYSEPQRLTPTASFVSFFESLKATASLVSLFAIAGFYDAGDGLLPSGCKGSPALTDACDPAQGNSVATCTVCVDESPVCPCHPTMTCPGGTSYPATNCCQADPAQRFYEAAKEMGSFGLASLCESSYGAFLSGWVAGAP